MVELVNQGLSIIRRTVIDAGEGGGIRSIDTSREEGSEVDELSLFDVMVAIDNA